MEEKRRYSRVRPQDRRDEEENKMLVLRKTQHTPVSKLPSTELE